MTIRQEAYQLIDDLADNSVKIVVEFMQTLPRKNKEADYPSPQPGAKTRKMIAFERLQEMRKEMASYHLADYETERAEAMREKYGDLVL